MARTGRYDEEAPHEAGVGANRPRVQGLIIRMLVIMAAASCSPPVASRLAKYDGDFRVPTLVGAQLLDHTACASSTRHTQYRHGYTTLGEKEASARAHTAHHPSARQNAQANRHYDKTPGLLRLRNPGRRQTAIFHLQGVL